MTESQPSEDRALLEQARTGDRAALEVLLERLSPSIHRFGRRMCKNEHDAEDVLQDTLISVAKNLDAFEGRSSLSSWVFALTRSACARKRRGLKNRPADGGDDRIAVQADAGPDPETQAEGRELGQALIHALDELSDEHREVLLLRDVEGLSAPETAEALGISVDAVKSRLHRARTALRGQLRPILEPAASPASAKCPDVDVLWSRKLEGDLSQVDCATMEAHIATCPTCGAACDSLKSALLACRRVRDEAVPEAVQARVKAAIRAFASLGSG